VSAARHKLRTLTRSHILVLGAAAVMVVFLVGSVLWAQLGQQQAQDDKGVVEQQRDQVAEQRDAKAAQAQSLAEQIKAACADGSLVGPVCEQAEQIAATPVPTEPPVPGPQGPPPTTEQIQAAVDAYLIAHPPPEGRPPNAAEVAAAVASYLTANPPTPGRPPTAEEISAAVAQYFADNPPPQGPKGDEGQDGEPGRPPTAEEIRAAVDSYLAAHPPPQGPKGDEGDPGPPPSSLTLTIDGTTQTCTRSGGTDTAPAYDCTGPAPPDEGETEPGEDQQGGLLDPLGNP
jgi:hypothetical protein